MDREPPPITVLIAEDHTVTRMGIKMFLESNHDITVVAEAANGKEAVELARATRPKVILMDVQMPELDGVESARLIKKELPAAKIVMMTSSKDEKDIFASLAAGASGYCTKDISDDRLLTAIRTVVAGDLWVDSNVAGKLLQALPKPEVATTDGAYELSDRELQILALIVDGLSNSQIATKLYISLDTVKSHIKHLLEKLSVNDRTQAAVKALRENLLS